MANAMAGVDECRDWQVPTDATGYEVSVCNQTALTDYLHPNGTTSPATLATPQVRNSTSADTADGTPEVVHESDPAALGQDVITPVSSPSDVFVSADRPDASGSPTQWEAKFTGIDNRAGDLHVDATGSVWKLLDSQGNIIATQTPVQSGCAAGQASTTLAYPLSCPMG